MLFVSTRKIFKTVYRSFTKNIKTFKLFKRKFAWRLSFEGLCGILRILEIEIRAKEKRSFQHQISTKISNSCTYVFSADRGVPRISGSCCNACGKIWPMAGAHERLTRNADRKKATPKKHLFDATPFVMLHPCKTSTRQLLHRVW